MSHDDVIRAWKDEEYRLSLSPSQRARLPENPAGDFELQDEEMQAVAGGWYGFFNGGTLSVKDDACPNTFTPGCGDNTVPKGICLPIPPKPPSPPIFGFRLM